MKKAIPIVAAAAILISAAFLLGATYSSSIDNGIITGNGSQTTNFGEQGFGTNQNAALQVSRNFAVGYSGAAGAGGQGSALDVYAGGDGGYIQRWWIDNPTVDGGKAAAILINNAGHFSMDTSMTISGLVANGGSASTYVPLHPTTDPYMLGISSDIGTGAAMYVNVCPPYTCSASNVAAQAFVAMDGTQPAYSANVRFAISGQDGSLRWTNSTSNTFAGATWDTTFGRMAAGILGDSTTNLQTSHLDQPTAKKDMAGTISIVAAANGTLVFGTSYASAPICVASPLANPGAVTWWVTTTAAQVKVNLSAASTITFSYVCVGNPN
jgi:hypothetical protein